MLNIPVKVYSTTSPKDIKFNMMSPTTHNRLRQKYFDPETNEEFSQSEALSGFEYEKNKYTIFTKEDLQFARENDDIQIEDFVKVNKLSLFRLKKSYHLGPNNGSDKSYKLLLKALNKTKMVAIGSWSIRKKESLVAIAPNNEGIVLHQLWYSEELNQFNPQLTNVSPSDQEVDLAVQLINQMASDKFSFDSFKNKFNEKVYQMINDRTKGRKIETYVEADISSFLKKSIAS